MTNYEHGFMSKCAEYGVDVNTARYLLKRAEEVLDDGVTDVMEISTDARLPKDERNRLKEELPSHRRKMIKKFLNKLQDGVYAVRTNEYGSPTATYDFNRDRLYYTKAQEIERDRRVRGKNMFWRSFLMGGVPVYSM